MAVVGWASVPLGEVAELDIERVAVEPDTGYRLVGVRIAGQGLFWRDTILGSETNYPTLHRLRSGQIVMRKLTAWEGPITTVPAEFDGGYVSSEFPTFTLNESRLLPEYMRLICQRPEFHAEMRMRSTGTAERRNRLKPEDLLSIDIELPPLDVQQKIAFVIAAADETQVALEAEGAALGVVTRALQESLVTGSGASPVKLGDVLDAIEGGKSPRCLDRPPEDWEWGVLMLSAVRPHIFNDRQAKALPPDVPPFPDGEVKPGDVIITRSNTRQRVGAVCRVRTTRPRLLLCDLTWRLKGDAERIDPDYLVAALTAAGAREQIEHLASGTSDSMKKISKRVLREIEIPLPDIETQREIGERVLTLVNEAELAAQERDRLAAVRAALVESLLSGERRVAESAILAEELAPE